MPAARRLASTALLAPLAAGAWAWQEEPPRAPVLEVPLVEEERARLAQIDVTVTGAPDVVAALGPQDFRLKIHMRWVDDFALDRDCPATGDIATDPGQGSAERGTAIAYLFYFDQLHLTLGGRVRALDLARELVGRLVKDGSRAMVASSARRLSVIQAFTDDPALLLAALDRLEDDRTQWDAYASEEDRRVSEVVERLETSDNVHAALGLAKTYQREEHSVADRSLRRLEAALVPLSDLGLRRAVIYFGDTLRQNPGEHYLTFFGTTLQRADPSVQDMASEAFMAASVFDRLVNAAAADGTRFYPVFAQGLVTPFDLEPPSARALELIDTVPASARTRFRDSQETLADMAAETGGQAFLRGESAERIAGRIDNDHACIYTLSFDPTGFPEDDPLRVVVDVRRKGVRATSRGRIVLQSDSTRRVARLLGGFAIDGSGDDALLEAHLVPTGFDGSTYVALLQISVPATALQAASWELGASLIRRDRVLDEVSATLTVSEAGVPVVLEREIRLAPGPLELVAVARETRTDFLLSEHVDVAWPDPDDRPVTCGPLVLLQPAAGAFARGERTRSTGSLARPLGAVVRTELPTALMGLVCRDRHPRGLLRVERSLTGNVAVDFPPLQFDLERERCVQVRDLIPGGSLRPGPYRYEMRVLVGDEVAHAITRDFVAAGPGR